jgi:hypothetical protein
MSIGHLKIEHRPRFEPEHRAARFQRLDLGEQRVLAPVDVLERLLEPELRPAHRLELFLLP